MGKLDTNKKVKEDSLLNTAFSLFTTKGVSKTSISDIVNNAGVAKGTFYLYFKDKYDIRNKLVSHKSSQLFRNAIEALNASGKKLTFNERIIFIVDNIINQLNENKSLLTFIAKNLSWGVFKHAPCNLMLSADFFHTNEKVRQLSFSRCNERHGGKGQDVRYT